MQQRALLVSVLSISYYQCCQKRKAQKSEKIPIVQGARHQPEISEAQYYI